MKTTAAKEKMKAVRQNQRRIEEARAQGFSYSDPVLVALMAEKDSLAEDTW